jgi:hypothetical protein
MVCVTCHREKTQLQEKPKRDWFLVTALMQTAGGGAFLWFSCWLLGKLLLKIPSEFHEGAIWTRFTGQE